MSERPTLTLDAYDPVRFAHRVPVHASHRIALVGEAPGPNTRADTPLYPIPDRSAAGRLKEMLGMSRPQYLRAFARANILDEYPGASFPVSRARPLAEPLCQRLAPRPLLLLGQGVAMAFGFPKQTGILEWADYRLGDTLCRAAVVPHPSGRNLWYNDPANKARARGFILQALIDLGAELAPTE